MGQFKWYLFPLEIKQILPIVLMNAQQPVNLKCIGSIPCDRETFKKVTEFEKRDEIMVDFVFKS